jgi:PAS domain S-box-containing protein
MIKNNNKIHVQSQDIIKGVGAGLCLVDRNFRIIWINKYQAEWFGVPEKICGRHCYKTFEHRKHICHGCPTLKVFKTGQVHTARRIGFTKDGQKRCYQLTVSPIKNGNNNPEFALELVQDITDKVMQEKGSLKIIQKLKRMSGYISLMNRRSRLNIQRLKNITGHITKIRSVFNKKYRRKINELFMLKEELRDIFKVSRTISSRMDLKKVTSLITRFTCELMHTDACMFRLLDERKKTLMVGSSYCFSDTYVRKLSVVKIGEGIAGIVAKTRRPLVIDDINNNSGFKYRELLKKEGFRAVLSVPVVFQNKLLGVLSACSRKPRNFTKEEIEVLSIFASHVAITIQESKHHEDIHRNYFDTIHALVLALEARDLYTRGHTERVTRYSIEMAKELKLPKAEIEVLRYAAEVHDVGKISIPDIILNKPGRLSPAEKKIIELHPVKGAEMLVPLEFLNPAIPAVRHHHERYDGTGYPDGLEKEEIPLMSRILACADSFDAMTSDRPYRNRRMTVEEALTEIKNNTGSQFDPRIAHTFIKIIRSKIH